MADPFALFGDHYALDGDTLRCTDCGQTQQASWGNDDHGFPHMANCPCVDAASPVPDKPWQALVDMICKASGYVPDAAAGRLSSSRDESQPPGDRPWRHAKDLDFDKAKPLYITVRWESRHSYRWLPYKRGSAQFQRGILGRWQKAGEYMGWDNATLPDVCEWAPAELP